MCIKIYKLSVVPEFALEMWFGYIFPPNLNLVNIKFTMNFFVYFFAVAFSIGPLFYYIYFYCVVSYVINPFVLGVA